MCRCQRTSSRNWFPPSTMWVLGSSLGHEAWLQCISVHRALCWLWKLLLTVFSTTDIYSSNSFNSILQIRNLTSFPYSQSRPGHSTFLFSLDCGEFSPSDSSSGPLFCFIPQIPSHLAALDFFPVVLWKVSRYLQRVCLVFKGKDTERGFRRYTPS